jgi:hypothetical protein
MAGAFDLDDLLFIFNFLNRYDVGMLANGALEDCGAIFSDKYLLRFHGFSFLAELMAQYNLPECLVL